MGPSVCIFYLNQFYLHLSQINLKIFGRKHEIEWGMEVTFMRSHHFNMWYFNFGFLKISKTARSLAVYFLKN